MLRESELDKYFPRPITSSITPEILPPHTTLTDLENAFKQTWEYWHLANEAPYKDRTIKLGLSGWEKVIPAIHAMFGIHPIIPASPNVPGRSDSSIIGTALHEVAPILEMSLKKDASPDQIADIFPTYKPNIVKNYASTLSGSPTAEFTDVWKTFQAEEAYIRNQIDKDLEWFGQEIPIEVVTPTDKDSIHEIQIRGSDSLQDLAAKLAERVREQKADDPESKTHYEVGIIANLIRSLSQKNNVRMQIPIRFDKITETEMKKGRLALKIADLKTGKPGLNYPQQFQALLMDYLAHHFYSWAKRNGIEKNYGYYIANFGRTEKTTNHQLTYEYFDQTNGQLKKVSISMVDDDGDESFRQALGLYASIIVAFKPQIKAFFRGQIDHLTPHFEEPVQNELPLTYLDLSNLPPARPKPEYPTYSLGESYAEENCPTCGRQMKQFCDRVTDLGGQKISFWVQTFCPGHHHDARKLTSVPRSLLKY